MDLQGDRRTSEFLDIQQQFLDAIKIRRNIIVPDTKEMASYIFDNIELSMAEVVDNVSNQLLMSLTTYLLSSKRIETNYIEYPKNWIEAFKKRWFPNWLLKRCPVKNNRISTNLTIYEYNPHLEIPGAANLKDRPGISIYSYNLNSNEITQTIDRIKRYSD